MRKLQGHDRMRGVITEMHSIPLSVLADGRLLFKEAANAVYITLRWDMRSVHRSSPVLTLPQQNKESPAGIGRIRVRGCWW